MEILALPIITSILLAYYYKKQIKKPNTSRVINIIFALCGSLTWAFVFSSWDDALTMSGLCFAGGFLSTLALKVEQINFGT